MKKRHVTFGTPKYVEAAKLGERLGKTDELIGKIEFLVEEICRGDCRIGTYKQRERIEQLAQQLSELT